VKPSASNKNAVATVAADFHQPDGFFC
jgi:hypothetical protein